MGNEKNNPTKLAPTSQLGPIGAPGTDSKIGGAGCGGSRLPLGLPQPLQLEEKKFLLAVERGDIANVRRILQKAHRKHHVNINCMDPLGRRALTLAIDNENLEMVELLVIMGVETKDALLHAINAEFVEAVELLLEHEELIHTEGELYSWQKVDINTAMFPPDITPLILAAHKNNFEILKILLDRGAAVPVPHDIRCGCEECVRQSTEDSLRHSLSRVNIYRALTSPSLICLTSSDPILTAFQLSWECRNLAFTEQECKSEYMDLRQQCQKFAVDLLDQTRSSTELAIILNYDPEISAYEPGDRMSLTRLVQAISYKQKKFVAHSNIQQLLSAIWYEGLPGFRRKTFLEKFLNIVKVAVLFPLYCMIYMFAPNCSTGILMRKPFMKFLIHASSYLFFLFILILVSQRADNEFIRFFGTERMQRNLVEEQLRQRGQGPTKLELLVVIYLFGFMWEEVQEIYTVGMNSYLRNMWNFIDFLRNSLYVSVICLRTLAYIQQSREIASDPKMAYVPREKWDDFDPQLIAEGLFAAANVFSALKLVHLFSINPHLGPLQISLGRMVIDIVKFFFIYSLVLFAFACGLNQLLWYFADLEKNKCYVLPNGEADWAGHGDSCGKWRRFGNLFESSQSLFWASFGMVGLDDFELTGIKSYTRFWGLLMFGSYCVINVIVLLNLLIAMMSNSYAMIDEQSDTEWKFARTKLWMSYFEDSATLPPPFNIMPSVKWLIRVYRKSSKEIDRKRSKKRQAETQENVYDNIMRSLVWRYVAAQHRRFEDNPVTEDDINEVKSEISTMRYEMLEIFESSGMDVSTASKKEKPCRAKRAKVWERRLMRGFQVAPIPTAEDGDMNEIKVEREPSRPGRETPKERFRRIARTVAAQSASHKWTVVLQGVAKNSQIGCSASKESYQNLKNLGKAIEEAKKLILMTPHLVSGRESPIRIEFEDEKTATLLDLLNQISEEIGENTPPSYINAPNSPFRSIKQAKRNFFTPPGLPAASSNPKALPNKTQQQQKQQQFYQQQIQSYSNRSQTLPEINIITPSVKSSANNSRIDLRGETKEQPLSVTKLNSQQQQQHPKPNQSKTTQSTQGAVTKTHAPVAKKPAAPSIPAPPVSSKNVPPFSVEMGRPGVRRPGYGRPVAGASENFDITLVDLDEQDMYYGDAFSGVSSIATMNSPTRGKTPSSERKMTKGSSVDSTVDDSNSKNTASGSSSNRGAPNASNNERGKKWL